MEPLQNSTGVRRWLLDKQSRRLARESLALKDKARALAAQQLRKAVKTSKDVAVELPDYSFRRMRPEEAHELVVAAERAKGVWLVVFKPNNLLAERNVMVACMM